MCGADAFALDVVDPGAGPRVDGECAFCSSPLWTVLDVDLADDRVVAALAHTGWSGRLRIVTCQFCSCYGPLFCEVTSDGGATWSPLTQRPRYLPGGREEPERPLFAVGERRATPYLASAWQVGGSTLGGYPDWIQDAEYLKCPRCGDYMDYVALVGGADMRTGEGAHYACLHARCGLAGVTYQQS